MRRINPKKVILDPSALRPDRNGNGVDLAGWITSQIDQGFINISGGDTHSFNTNLTTATSRSHSLTGSAIYSITYGVEGNGLYIDKDAPKVELRGVGHEILIGDFDGNGNGTSIKVDDNNTLVEINGASTAGLVNIQAAGGTILIGDVYGTDNNTTLTVDDTITQIKLYCKDYVIGYGNINADGTDGTSVNDYLSTSNIIFEIPTINYGGVGTNAILVTDLDLIGGEVVVEDQTDYSELRAGAIDLSAGDVTTDQGTAFGARIKVFGGSFDGVDLIGGNVLIESGSSDNSVYGAIVLDSGDGGYGAIRLAGSVEQDNPIHIGDYFGNGNSTLITVDDNAQTIGIGTDGSTIITVDNDNNQIIMTTGFNGPIIIGGEDIENSKLIVDEYTQNVVIREYRLQSTGTISDGMGSEAGGLFYTSASVVQAMGAAATSVTTFDIPTGAVLLAAQFNVDTTVTTSGGDNTWSAAFSGGSTTTLAAAGRSGVINTKVNTGLVPAVATNTTNVTFTAGNGENFAGGSIEVVVYYMVVEPLADVV